MPFVLTAFLVACEKTDTLPEQPLEVITVANLYADTTTGFSPTGRPIGENKFTYFSIRENKIITGADTLTNKWDFAFKQFYIKVNGGTNATGGYAAAFVANSTFEAYTQISDADMTMLKQDDGALFAINPAPGGWYTYSPSTFLALPIPGKIMVVRTADGRYAKLEITSFYKNGITPEVSASPVQKALAQFFYQFRYTFQPNGNKSF
jgi:hypothetical protein